uniref:Uncharacterized protein n=1 Tax=viral metagenome TaxID=1070528 RepID=A0A6C0BUP5_9ZZZZ
MDKNKCPKSKNDFETQKIILRNSARETITLKCLSNVLTELRAENKMFKIGIPEKHFMT